MKQATKVVATICAVGATVYFAYAALLMFAIVGPADIEYARSLHYRVTINFSTPAGPVVATSVQEWRLHVASSSFIGGGGRRAVARTYGEVPFTSLPGGGYAFATFSPAPSIIRACGIPSSVASGLSPSAWIDLATDKFTGTCEIPEERWPIIVFFADPADRSTANAYRPHSLPSGIKVTSYTVSRTDERLTRGIDDVLSWIQHSKDSSAAQSDNESVVVGDERRSPYPIADWIFVNRRPAPTRDPI